jgi:hypothetical protein
MALTAFDEDEEEIEKPKKWGKSNAEGAQRPKTSYWTDTFPGRITLEDALNDPHPLFCEE